MQVLLKATVLECAEKTRADALASKALQKLELLLTIDEMVYLRSVYSEQKLAGMNVS